MRTIDIIIQAIRENDIKKFEKNITKLLKLKTGIMTRVVDASFPEEQGISPYQALAYYDRPLFLPLILQHPFEYALPPFTKRKAKKVNPLSLMSPFHIAAMKGHKSFIEAFVKQNRMFDLNESRGSGTLKINGLEVSEFRPLSNGGFHAKSEVGKYLIENNAA